MRVGSIEILERLKRIVRRFRPAARGELDGLEARISQRIDSVLGKLDVDPQLVLEWLRYRETPEYDRAYTEPEPLVTVCIPTYNRSEILVNRCLPSVLGQSYRNIEVIVIGDHCTDDTAERIRKVNDPRLYFENLAAQGPFPRHPDFRWMVVGYHPRNRALEMARGLWITDLDDDDEYTPERIGSLIAFAQQQRADIVYHPFLVEQKPSQWVLNPAVRFQAEKVTTGSIFYHGWFRNILWDGRSWSSHEPNDWNRFRKFAYLKPNIQRLDALLLKHYGEGSFRNLT